jgi:predicted dienelactone hydrolase
MIRRLPFVTLLAAPLMWAQLPPGCAAFPTNCLYTPGPVQTVASIATSISYLDQAEELRTVQLYVRVPTEATGSLPVVIWSPAAGAPTAPQDVMSRWSEATARAGYLTVSVAHAERDTTDRAALCLAQGLDTPRDCYFFNPVNWDWPNDLRQVITWLEQVNESGPPAIRGRIDLNRIGVAGFADGSSGALSLAGARRMLVSERLDEVSEFSDPRPIAYVALSPQGPTLAGFFDTEIGRTVTSWTPIEHPVLVVSGAGDNDCRYVYSGCASGDTPSRRRIPFELMPEGNKYEMFVDSIRISHDFIGTLDTAACVAAGVPQTQCRAFDEWLRSAVIAFLDANVRGVSAAAAWLRAGLIAPASNRTVIWSSK